MLLFGRRSSVSWASILPELFALFIGDFELLLPRHREIESVSPPLSVSRDKLTNCLSVWRVELRELSKLTGTRCS